MRWTLLWWWWMMLLGWRISIWLMFRWWRTWFMMLFSLLICRGMSRWWTRLIVVTWTGWCVVMAIMMSIFSFFVFCWWRRTAFALSFTAWTFFVLFMFWWFWAWSTATLTFTTTTATRWTATVFRGTTFTVFFVTWK